ncbi:putative glutamate--cysteine ligase catalytic subunit isoform X2, partial [Apostichopus japonicus]
PLKNDRFRIPKSRYDSVDSYLSPDNAKFNDTHLVMDEQLCQEMIDGGVDTSLARHVAHLFIRDPVSLFSEKIEQDDENDSDHFENIQSTNWQSMRFKPPPVNSDIGWRVEFRPMEVQLTDFENAAFVVFLVLLTRAILTFKLNFVIPISKVDANMQESHKRDAVRKGKFHFRKELHSKSSNPEDVTAEMDINTIINGGKTEAGTDFPGLIPLVNSYIATLDDADVDTTCTISQYFKLLSDRAAGRLKTTARWMRDFVDSHPSYRHDSVISEEVNYDLIKTIANITKGNMDGAQGLLHTTVSKSVDEIPESLQGTGGVSINGSM